MVILSERAGVMPVNGVAEPSSKSATYIEQVQPRSTDTAISETAAKTSPVVTAATDARMSPKVAAKPASNVPVIHHHRHNLKNRFELLKTLGQGTYGKVKLAVEFNSGDKVAIKYIRKNRIQDEYDLNRIRREIKIMASLHHPHVINVREVFENKEKIVLVMEYAKGGELYEYINVKKRLDEKEARQIFRHIVSAVDYCHQNGIVHRDLKLENIVLTEEGIVKIADFGLSNYFSKDSLLSTYCGSPLYASPEIVNGTPYVGPEVDCWSLGVVLYTLVYGAMPFDGTEFKVLKQQITTGTVYEPRLKSAAHMLILALLEPNPTLRATVSNIVNHWWVNAGYTSTVNGRPCNVVSRRRPHLSTPDLTKRHSWSDSPYRKILAIPATWNNPSSRQTDKNNGVQDERPLLVDENVNRNSNNCLTAEQYLYKISGDDLIVSHDRSVSDPIPLTYPQATSDFLSDNNDTGDIDSSYRSCQKFRRKVADVGEFSYDIRDQKGDYGSNGSTHHGSCDSNTAYSESGSAALEIGSVGCETGSSRSESGSIASESGSLGSEEASSKRLVSSSDEDKKVFDAMRKPKRGILKKNHMVATPCNVSIDSDSGCLSESSGLPSPPIKGQNLAYDVQDIENALSDTSESYDPKNMTEKYKKHAQAENYGHIAERGKAPDKSTSALYENLQTQRVFSCNDASQNTISDMHCSEQYNVSSNECALSTPCDNTEVPKTLIKGILKRRTHSEESQQKTPVDYGHSENSTATPKYPEATTEFSTNPRNSVSSYGSNSSHETLDQSFERFDLLQNASNCKSQPPSDGKAEKDKNKDAVSEILKNCEARRGSLNKSPTTDGSISRFQEIVSPKGFCRRDAKCLSLYNDSNVTPNGIDTKPNYPVLSSGPSYENKMPNIDKIMSNISGKKSILSQIRSKLLSSSGNMNALSAGHRFTSSSENDLTKRRTDVLLVDVPGGKSDRKGDNSMSHRF